MKEVSLIRRCILAALMFGVLGSNIELLLIEHYEEVSQFVPIVLMGFALLVILWHGLRPSATNLRVLQVTMMLFLIAGTVGIVLHFRGAAEFQWELDPSQSVWNVFKKVMRAKAPPVLAPGILLQLGIIGLVYGHGHPAAGSISQIKE